MTSWYYSQTRGHQQWNYLKLLVVEPFQEFAPSCVSKTLTPVCWKARVVITRKIIVQLNLKLFSPLKIQTKRENLHASTLCQHWWWNLTFNKAKQNKIKKQSKTKLNNFNNRDKYTKWCTTTSKGNSDILFLKFS